MKKSVILQVSILSILLILLTLAINAAQAQYEFLPCLEKTDNSSFFIKGDLIFDPDINFTDFCENNTLIEYGRDNGNLSIEFYNCASGCIEGVCISDADTNRDGCVGINEIAKYTLDWKTGATDTTIDDVTSAAFDWLTGVSSC